MATSTPIDWIGLEPILERYEVPLVGYARRLTGDLEAARDVVQDVFLQLLRQASPPDDDRLAAWLYTVCRHRAIDLARRRRRLVDLGPAGWRRIPDDIAPDDGDDDPTLLDAVAALPDLEQEALWLKFVDRLTYAEIGAIVGKSPSHVGVIIHRAMVTLRRRLVPQPGGAESMEVREP